MGGHKFPRGRAKRKAYNRQLPNPVELREIYEELFKKPNVQFCFIGEKAKKGVQTPLISIVCGVKSKVKKKDIDPADLIPSQLSWLKHASKPRLIQTDVIEMPIKFDFRQSPIVGPGDQVFRENGANASIGIAMQHPSYGPVVTTAGHLFPPKCGDEGVTVQSGLDRVSGVLKKRIRNAEADYALIQMNEPCRILNLFRDRYAVGPPYFPRAADINKELKILTPGAGPSIQAKCKGIHGYFHEQGGPAMSDLILTDDVTHVGHSGACLIDDTGSVWGLLVGGTCNNGNSFSAFMPAYIPLLRERAQLI